MATLAFLRNLMRRSRQCAALQVNAKTKASLSIGREMDQQVSPRPKVSAGLQISMEQWVGFTKTAGRRGNRPDSED